MPVKKNQEEVRSGNIDKYTGRANVAKILNENQELRKDIEVVRSTEVFVGILVQ